MSHACLGPSIALQRHLESFSGSQDVTGGIIGWMWLHSGLASQNDRVKLGKKLETGPKWYNMVQPRVLKHMVKPGVAPQKSEGVSRAVVWGLCDLLHMNVLSTQVRRCQSGLPASADVQALRRFLDFELDSYRRRPPV